MASLNLEVCIFICVCVCKLMVTAESLHLSMLNSKATEDSVN